MMFSEMVSSKVHLLRLRIWKRMKNRYVLICYIFTALADDPNQKDLKISLSDSLLFYQRADNRREPILNENTYSSNARFLSELKQKLISPFAPYSFLFRLRRYMKRFRQCFIRFSNTSNFVNNILFSVCGNRMKHVLVFNSTILLDYFS